MSCQGNTEARRIAAGGWTGILLMPLLLAGFLVCCGRYSSLGGEPAGTAYSPADSGTADIVVFSNPDLAKKGLQHGLLVSPDRWIEQNYLKEPYHESLLDMLMVEGRSAALWYRANIRSLVWYSVPVFERQGFRLGCSGLDRRDRTEECRNGCIRRLGFRGTYLRIRRGKNRLPPSK